MSEYTRGDCFIKAFETVLDGVYTEGGDQARLFLCHGIPTLTGGPYKGQRYGHAWVEWDVSPVLTLVIERSNGHNKMLPRDTYYEAGTINPREVVRYTRGQALKMAAMHDHAGPWLEYDEDVLFSTPADDA